MLRLDADPYLLSVKARKRMLPRFCFVILMVLFLSYWHTRVTSQFSLIALAAFLLIASLALLYGHFFVMLVGPKLEGATMLPLQFLCGYFVLSTLLFILSLVSPLGAVNNFLVLVGAALCAAVFRRSQRRVPLRCESHVAPFLCLGISGVGATLWASDALTFVTHEGSLTVFGLFFDSFLHGRLISEFSHGHGIATLSDIRMAGAKGTVYHYASYAIPAVFASITRTGAYEVFAGFQLPFGILLSGLAAFSFAAFLWGPWSGIAATIGLILLPDAFQQGFGNRYLSYNFLQQVNAGGLYGVAYITIAWMLILDACQTGRVSSVWKGWVVAVLIVVHKAQLFVANAFLVMIYPFLFFARIKGRTRLALGLLFVAVFLMVVSFSQRFPEVPTLRLDGSGAGLYVAALLSDYDPGVIKSFFTAIFRDESLPRPVLAFYAVAMLLISTFGAWGFAFALIAFFTSRTAPRVVWVFPIVILVNYIVMSLGLAMDRNEVGTPDELLNRPLVWAYFVIVTWTSGAAYAFSFGRRLPKTIAARAALASMGLLSIIFPLILSDNLQTFPTRPGFGTFREQSGVPNCVVEAAHYIRENSQMEDVIQDSEGDPRFVLTSLAERPEFAVNYFRAPSGLKERLSSLEEFKAMTTEREIIEFATRNRISWYVLRPPTTVAWPSSLLQRTQFSCNDVKVYRFAGQ